LSLPNIEFSVIVKYFNRFLIHGHPFLFGKPAAQRLADKLRAPWATVSFIGLLAEA